MGKTGGMKAAIIFPGEQNQYVGMMGECWDMPVVEEMLEMATECFGFDVEEMMRVGPTKMMARSDYNQMLMYVANCVAFEVLKQEHPDVAECPHGVAGFSVGEYSALVAADVMTYDQGLIIVKARAEAMQK